MWHPRTLTNYSIKLKYSYVTFNKVKESDHIPC